MRPACDDTDAGPTPPQRAADERAGPKVAALAPDLMFASRIQGAARGVGADARTLATADAVLAQVRAGWPGLVIVDLEARAVDAVALIRAVKSVSAVSVVAFAAHVNAQVIAAARAAGADRVLARSAFVRELPRLLRGE